MEYKAFLLKKNADISISSPLPRNWDWDTYHNSSDVKALLEFLAKEYPNIATIFPIGTSRRGRELMAIKVVIELNQLELHLSDSQTNLHEEVSSLHIVLCHLRRAKSGSS